MAISASCVWEARASATGSMVNGGGFVTGASGSDFSQQDAAQYNLTSVTTAGADAILLHASAAADMVGNICRVVSGTNFTTGWYEIISVVAGVSITLDRTVTTGAGASGVVNVGGALSFNSTLDDDFLEQMVAGQTLYFKAGSFLFGETISVVASSATSTTTINIIGYNATRGDSPAKGSRPVIDCVGGAVSFGQYMNMAYVDFLTTAANGVTFGAGALVRNCSARNSSTTASRPAFRTAGADVKFFQVEAVSHNGTGILLGGSNNSIVASYMHDSAIGADMTGSNVKLFMAFNLIESCSTTGISIGAGATGVYINNTIYGSQAKIGTGILIADLVVNCSFYNNILAGLTTGISQTTTQQKSNAGLYNCFHNNTTNATNYTLSTTDITSDPQFTGASQVTGSTATTSGSVLTQSGGDFSSVTDNVDFLRVVSGTGVTTGIYLITGHTGTTITVSGTLGTSSGGDVVYVVPVGHNFAVGANVQGAGRPNGFGTETTAYTNIGAVQEQASVGGSGGGPIFGGMVIR